MTPAIVFLWWHITQFISLGQIAPQSPLQLSTEMLGPRSRLFISFNVTLPRGCCFPYSQTPPRFVSSLIAHNGQRQSKSIWSNSFDNCMVVNYTERDCNKSRRLANSFKYVSIYGAPLGSTLLLLFFHLLIMFFELSLSTTCHSLPKTVSCICQTTVQERALIELLQVESCWGLKTTKLYILKPGIQGSQNISCFLNTLFAKLKKKGRTECNCVYVCVWRGGLLPG